MYNFEWIDIRTKYPVMSGEKLLVTDGENVAIHECINFIFNPIKLIRGKKMFFLPKYWYPLSEVVLPES